MANAITNPLYGLKVGSVAFGEDARFGASVFGSGTTITNFDSGASGEVSMSGSSEYVYSDKMNQGSFGVSGSYGLSGVSKISGKLAGYVGHTVANSGKTLSIMLNAIDWAGVEYIDFNRLNAEDLMSALSENPRKRLAKALAKFSAMQKAVAGTTDPRTLVYLPAIDMTLRGIFLAGKWKDEATLKNMSDDACRKALIEKLREHTYDEEKAAQESRHFNWDEFDNDVLIGCGAVVVFLLQTGIRNAAQLKTDTADGHRNVLIYCLGAPDQSGLINRNLVQVALASPLNVKPGVKEWVEAVEEFFIQHGTGLVVGVLWGGWGAAELEIHTTGEENRWKYGGSGNFTYTGVGATLSISAAYGGSQSTIDQHASAGVRAFYNGACVQTKIEAWANELKQLANQNLSDLGKQDVTRNATLGAPIDAPAIPDFAKPQKDTNVTDLFKEIKSLDGLKAYAQAAAWEKNKKAGNTESLEDFLKKAGAKNDVSGIPDGATVSPTTAADSDDDSSFLNLRAAPPPAGDAPKPEPQHDSSKYEPLGVWIANWTRLFPWLVTGHDNAITAGIKALDWIRLKTLHQDCLSLTRLYDRLEGEGCSIVGVDFPGIRDSFSRVATLIADFLNERPAATVVSEKIKYFISEMSADARNIYVKWDQVQQFRRCELGAGVMLEHQDLPRTTVLDLKIQGSRIEIQHESLVLEVPKYHVFARYGKAWPFIAPDGEIFAFVSVGSASTSGILSFRRTLTPNAPLNPIINDTFFLTKQAISPNWPDSADWIGSGNYTSGDPWFNADIALPFKPSISTWNQTVADFVIGIFIQGQLRGHHLFPIPFDAAHGVQDWKGCAMTTGMGTLGKDLKAIKDELSQLKRYTFDSDFWDGVSDVKDLIYSFETLNPSYIGVTEPPPNNIMP